MKPGPNREVIQAHVRRVWPSHPFQGGTTQAPFLPLMFTLHDPLEPGQTLQVALPPVPINVHVLGGFAVVP